MKALLLSLFSLLILAIFGAIAYVGYYLYQQKNTLPVFPPSLFGTQATSTLPVVATSTPPVFATSTADMTGWKNYSDKELGFDIAYPADLIVNTSATTLVLSFPKDIYFHWPLQDDAKVVISATSTCPGLLYGAGAATSSSFTLNRQTFSTTRGSDAAAGTRTDEVVFDTHGNGACYHLSYIERGANGAGLYVNDPSLISRYDAQHAVDTAKVVDIVNGMVQTFNVRTIEGGMLER